MSKAEFKEIDNDYMGCTVEARIDRYALVPDDKDYDVMVVFDDEYNAFFCALDEETRIARFFRAPRESFEVIHDEEESTPPTHVEVVHTQIKHKGKVLGDYSPWYGPGTADSEAIRFAALALDRRPWRFINA